MSAALREEGADYEALLQFVYMAPVGLIQTTLGGETLLINPLCAQLLMPVCRDGTLGNLFAALESVAPDLRSLASSFKERSGMICQGLRIQLNVGGKSKLEPQVLTISVLKIDENRLMAVLSDVTEQVKRERLLRHNEAWLNAVLTGISDYAIVSLDASGCIDDWNESIGRVTGYDRDAAIGKPYSIFYPDGATTPERLLDRLCEADENGWSIDDGWRRRSDGSRFWGNALISPVHVGDDSKPASKQLPADSEHAQAAYCLVIRDITDKRDASENIRKASSSDHLTGIANRRALFEAAEIEIGRWKRRPRPLSIILVDADHFKRVNDTYGHAAGDAVLKHIAATLTAAFRECDISARVGGEEFAVLLPSAALSAAMEAATRLLHIAEASTVTVEGVPISYTLSAGIATMADDIADFDQLLKRADKALYTAKHRGRNCVASWST